MRPYRGLGAIIATRPIFYTQYDSLQTSFNRRFRNGWQGGVNWTLSLRHKGNTFSPKHLQHNADGTIGLRPEQDAVDEVLSNAGLRRHLIKGNFVWNLPDIVGGRRGVEGARRDRQRLAGVRRLHRRQRRALRRHVLVPDRRREREPDRIAELPRAYPHRWRHRLGLLERSVRAVQRERVRGTDLQQPRRRIRRQPAERLLGSRRPISRSPATSASAAAAQLQFRLDIFNAFNSVVINARNTTIQYNNPAAATTITNNQYNADGSLNTARLTPATAGAGAATGAQAMRSMQMQIRFRF